MEGLEPAENSNTRVVTFLPNLDYIRLKRGMEGEKRVLEEMKRRGFGYNFRNMKKTELVPMGARKEFFHVVVDVFGWDKNRIYDMGVHSPKVSFVIKHFFGLVLSPAKLLRYAPDMWREHYTSGESSKFLRLAKMRRRWP